MPLNREQFARAEALYFQANGLPQGQWQAFLAEHCADDEMVRNEVGALLGLRHSSQIERPLQRAMSAALGGTLALTSSRALSGRTDGAQTDPAVPGAADSYIGTQIGPYLIQEVIGRGGMGLVFRAEQQHPVRRVVALKLVRAGMDSPDLVARFESERQAVALMNHPNVARVFDAGATDDGRHYFVMEYVADARPITSWCDANRATVEQRLRLFIDVCEAVHHAHQRGVIHRDLKPSNILVTTVDGKPVAKVIDFGVAKAIERALSEQSPVTHAGELIGTPQYMSPEQADLRVQDVDTRSDIYALGVILYELLTGQPPFAIEELRDKGLDHVLRKIREVDPLRPSLRVEREAGTAGARELAGRRQSDPTRLARQLRGELDWVIGKALEKDRARRYPSAAEFAEDLRRTLANEPVLAGPPSTLYRVRKFVRRHRVPVAAACLLALVILTGVIGTTWQAVRATRAEHAARQRFNDIRKLADTVLFDLDETLRTQGPTKARQAVVATALKYLDGLASEAGDDVSLRHDISRGYRLVGNIQFSNTMTLGGGSLGDLPGALISYRKAVDLARSVAADVPGNKTRSEVALCLLFLGDTQRAQEDYTAALASYDEARTIFASIVAVDPNDEFAARHLPMALDRRGTLFKSQNKREAAIEAYAESLKLREARARKMPQDAAARLDLAQSRQYLSEFENETAGQDVEARHIEAMLPAVRRSLASDPDNPRRQRDLAVGLQRLAALKLGKGQVNDLLPMIEEAVRLEVALLQHDPANTIVQEDLAEALATLGMAKQGAGKLDQSIVAHERSVAVRRKLMVVQGVAAGSRRLAVGLAQLSVSYRNASRYAEAIAAAEEASNLLEQRMAAQPDDASRAAVVDALDLLADTCVAAGRQQDADAARERRQKYSASPASSPTSVPALAPG